MLYFLILSEHPKPRNPLSRCFRPIEKTTYLYLPPARIRIQANVNAKAGFPPSKGTYSALQASHSAASKSSEVVATMELMYRLLRPSRFSRFTNANIAGGSSFLRLRSDRTRPRWTLQQSISRQRRPHQSQTGETPKTIHQDNDKKLHQLLTRETRSQYGNQEGEGKTRNIPQLLPREIRSNCNKQFRGEMMVILP